MKAAVVVGDVGSEKAPEGRMQWPWRLLSGAAVKESRRMASSAFRHTLAAGILLFYSTSIVGAVIRACVGA